MCKAGNWKVRRSIRPNRNIALRIEDYEGARDLCHFGGFSGEHPKGGKSDRNSNRTFWHDTYQLCRQYKMEQQY
jgi:hypothetical protein